MINSEITANGFRSPEEQKWPFIFMRIFIKLKKKPLVNADILGIKCISSFGVKCWTKRGFPYSILKVMVTKLFEGVTSMIRKAIRAFS